MSILKWYYNENWYERRVNEVHPYYATSFGVMNKKQNNKQQYDTTTIKSRPTVDKQFIVSSKVCVLSIA